MHLKKHILLYTVLPLTVLMVATSFYRFMISYEYTVSYEGDCDPYSESCYIYCEDDECAEPIYFSAIYRDASVLVELCGDDITECDAAHECVGDDTCEMYFCDPETETDMCEDLTEADRVFDSLEDASVELSDSKSES